MENISKDEFTKLEFSVSQIKGLLDDVHHAIVGNPLSKDGGMSARLKEAEKKLDDIEARLHLAEKKQIKYNVYTIIMWVSLGGVSMAILAFILQLIFK